VDGLSVASRCGLLLGQPQQPGYTIAFAVIALGSVLTLVVGPTAQTVRDIGA
jgi:hypothetical protein